jgi:hypothetical protein
MVRPGLLNRCGKCFLIYQTGIEHLHAANPEVSPFPREDIVELPVANTWTVRAIVPVDGSAIPTSFTVLIDDNVANYQNTSLPSIPSAMAYLTHMLDAQTPSDGITRCMCVINTSDYDGQFLQVMQGTLVDIFVNAANRDFFYDRNHEMHSWFTSFIPMFNYLGNKTDLVQFLW